jgi:hypothetical protein
MSALFPFIPRVDSAGTSRAGLIDVNQIGGGNVQFRLDAKGRYQVTEFGKLGIEIGHSSAVAKQHIAHRLMLAWPGCDQKKAQDAAADFVTSGLNVVLGAGEDVIRPTARTLFVPGPGMTPVIPSRNLLEPGLRTNSFKIRQRHGQAQWVAPEAIGRELNRAGFMDEEERRGAEYYAIAWGYSIPSTWEGKFLGVDPQFENQMAATEALDDFRERVSLWGDAEKKLSGFATLDGAGLILGGQQFSSTVPTAIQMMQRIAEFEQQFMDLNGNMKPTAAMAPDSDRYAMQNTYFGTGSEGDSVWKRALEQYPWFANMTWSNDLMLANEAGTGSRWILYIQDPKNLYIEHTDTMLFGPFTEYLNFTFVALRRHGGVVSRMPERVMYVDFTP